MDTFKIDPNVRLNIEVNISGWLDELPEDNIYRTHREIITRRSGTKIKAQKKIKNALENLIKGQQIIPSEYDKFSITIDYTRYYPRNSEKYYYYDIDFTIQLVGNYLKNSALIRFWIEITKVELRKVSKISVPKQKDYKTR